MFRYESVVSFITSVKWMNSIIFVQQLTLLKKYVDPMTYCTEIDNRLVSKDKEVIYRASFMLIRFIKSFYNIFMYFQSETILSLQAIRNLVYECLNISSGRGLYQFLSSIEGMLLFNAKSRVRRLVSVSSPPKRTKFHSLVTMSRYNITDKKKIKIMIKMVKILRKIETCLHTYGEKETLKTSEFARRIFSFKIRDGIIEEIAIICYEDVGDDDDYSQYKNITEYSKRTAIAISAFFLFILVLAYIFTPHKLELQKRCTFACCGNFFLAFLILFIKKTVYQEYVARDDGHKCLTLEFGTSWIWPNFDLCPCLITGRLVNSTKPRSKQETNKAIYTYGLGTFNLQKNWRFIPIPWSFLYILHILSRMPIGNMFFDCSDADHSLIKISKFYSIVYYQARELMMEDVGSEIT
ncbi:hypothetical protein Avbf_10491 [Armadillidium vulgare]|nr:hypothetical protein Avbf_10491 [Armadillidium vulgare]